MVDDLRGTPRNKNWRWKETCHMFADCPENADELHQFAVEIGLRREWFQDNKTSIPHYDLTRHKKLMVLLKGAQQVSDKEIAQLIKVWRKYRQHQSGAQIK